MAEYWRLNHSVPEGAQWWTCWTTVADVATANTAGQITDAPTGVRKGDFIDIRTGCSAVTSATLRAAFTGAAILRATADAASGAVDLSDNETMTDSD